MAERDAASSIVLLRKRKARDIEAQRRSAETLVTRLVMIVVVEISRGNTAKPPCSEVTSVARVVGESCSVMGSRVR